MKSMTICGCFQGSMTVEKDERSKSPVHVTVDDETPVHVHVKKPSTKKTKAAYMSGVSRITRFL